MCINDVMEHEDGIVIHGDSYAESTRDYVYNKLQKLVPLFVCDPPYGNIVSNTWDKVGSDVDYAKVMAQWASMWKDVLIDGGSMYVWGTEGKYRDRPFYRFLLDIEQQGFVLKSVVTWSKKRARGSKSNYLWTKEDCAYLIKGTTGKPAIFNIPYLETKRGYAGYDPEHPAKSEYYRRTTVWSDVTEILAGKWHDTQKRQRVIEIPIEVHTNPGDTVIDLFGGCGTTAIACRKLGRRYVIVENDEYNYKLINWRLANNIISETRI